MIRIIAISLCVLAFTPSPQASGDEKADQNRATIQAHFERAEKLLEAGQTQAAAREFRTILDIDPDNADAYADLGTIAYFEHDYAGAAHQLSDALRLKPSLSNARALLGLSEERLGHLPDAALQLRQAFPEIRSQKLRLQVGLQLAQIDYQEGNIEEAVPVLMALQRLDPTNLDILYASYRTFNELTEQAVDALAVVGMHSARMKQVVAENLIEEGHLAGAIAAYQAALKLDPQLPGIHLELGEAYLESPSRFTSDDAEKEFKAELAQDPNNVKAECELGYLYLRRGDLSSSLSHYEHAILLQPTSSEAHVGAGMVLLRTNRFQQAAAELRKAIQLNPDNALAHYQLSLTDSRLGKAGESQTEAATFKRLRSFNDQLRNLFDEMQRPGEAKAESGMIPQAAAGLPH